MSTTGGGTSPIGRFGRLTPWVTAQYSKPAAATQYSIGDLIGNSLTAASVTPITFSNAARFVNGSGRLIGASCVVTAASGTIVLPAFDLLVFRPYTNIPFAVGSYPADNDALDVSAAAMIQLIGVFPFASTTWRNQAGGATAAGDHIYQDVDPANRAQGVPFELQGLDSTSLLGLMQAQNTWNPGNVAQTFDFTLDVEQD